MAHIQKGPQGRALLINAFCHLERDRVLFSHTSKSVPRVSCSASVILLGEGQDSVPM